MKIRSEVGLFRGSCRGAHISAIKRTAITSTFAVAIIVSFLMVDRY